MSKDRSPEALNQRDTGEHEKPEFVRIMFDELFPGDSEKFIDVKVGASEEEVLKAVTEATRVWGLAADDASDEVSQPITGVTS